jgi:hypothetical protein
MARRRTAFEWRQLFLTTLVCTVGLGACGVQTKTSRTTTTTRGNGSSTTVTTRAGRPLSELLAGRTFIVAKPDGAFPTHVLRPASTVTFPRPGTSFYGQYVMTGYDACNFVGHSGSLEGDHLLITETMTTAAGCPYDGLPWQEPRDAKLALSDDDSTVTVTSSSTGNPVFLLLDASRLPLALGESLVGTYQLTPKRLLVLDKDGTGRILDAASSLVTCPITWTPPPAFSISQNSCPADEELRSPYGESLRASGEMRQRSSSLFVGDFAFAKIAAASASAPAPTPDLLANWPARPSRSFTSADVPVLLPADRRGRYGLFDGYVSAPDTSSPRVAEDHFVQYLVNTTNPTDLLVVDTSLGLATLDRLGDPIPIKGWAGAWSNTEGVTLVSKSGRVALTGSNARQQADRLARRANDAGWDLTEYATMFEGWRYPPAPSRSIEIDADGYKAYIRVRAAAAEIQAFEIIGPKLERIDLNGHPASVVESVGTWDVTWSPAPDVIATVSYTMPGPTFDYEVFSALRSAAIAFARSLQTGTLEELNALVAG